MFKNKYVQIGVVVIIVISAAIFMINDFYGENTSSKDKNGAIATTTILMDDRVGIKGTGDYTIETIDNIEPPSLDRPVVISALLDAEAQAILANNIEELTEQLRILPDRVDLWLNLGLYHKIAGDYESARDIWEYLNIVSPENSTSFANLGDLYHHYLKDFPKAEQNLRTAIENNKKIGAYKALHELYKYSYKQDTTLAVDILLEGLRENPDNVDLLITLAAYYKETGNTINAKKYYEQARDEAQKLGNTQLVELLNEEISRL